MMTTPALGLAATIGRLYDAFAVPKPQAIDGCPCCIDRNGVDVRLGTPLRELSPDAPASYASSAFLTVGEVADYLYFLPRILEVTATDLAWWPDPEVTGRAVHAAGVLAWPADRRAALDGFLAAVVGDAIRTAGTWRLDSWLCAIGRMGLDVGPYLDQVATAPGAVRDYHRHNADGLSRGRLSNLFWEPPDPAHDTILRWLRSPEVEALLREGEEPDPHITATRRPTDV